jgi:hypothetical protein
VFTGQRHNLRYLFGAYRPDYVVCGAGDKGSIFRIGIEYSLISRSSFLPYDLNKLVNDIQRFPLLYYFIIAINSSFDKIGQRINPEGLRG